MKPGIKVIAGCVAIVFVGLSLYRCANERVQVELRHLTEGLILQHEFGLRWYYQDHNDYPETLPRFSNDVAQSSPSAYDGATDTWGRPFIYERQGRTNFVIRSLGRDGKIDTTDDLIGNRETAERHRRNSDF